jgi:O-antigen/teichoic acid export membrane protein
MHNKFSFKGEFFKNVATLMTGTIAAQVFTVAVSPILTRIFTPADFGVLAVFTALNAVLAIIAAGRYETAIMLPQDDNDALNIVVLSASITFVVCGLLQGGIFVFAEDINRMANTPLAGKWIHLLPLSVALTTGTQIMIYWNNRGKKFRQLSITRAIHGFSTGVSQCGLGYGPGGSISLVAGHVLGHVLSLGALVQMNRASLAASRTFVSWATIKENAKKYRRFPLFSVWGALFDSSASQVPLFVIASFFSASVTGLFGFTIKVLSLPLFLISSAVSEVLYQKIAQLDHANPSSLRSYIFRIFVLLSVVTVPFCLLFTLYGVEIFSFVFGKDWKMAGEFAGPLSIAAGVRFMVSPLSVVLNLNHNVTKGVGWQVSYFLTLTAVMLSSAGQGIGFLLWAFVTHEVVLFSVYFAVIVWASKHPQTDNHSMSLRDIDGTIGAKATAK